MAMKSSLNAISQLPSLPLVGNQSCIIGNVTIHPQVAIAPGVVIQAPDPSQVIIEAGVCIGMGVVINAYQGTVVIEEGAVLGARVLILGQGRIGKNACIGAFTTIFDSSVAPMKVISAYSVLGDFSRTVDLTLTKTESINNSINYQLNEELKDPWADQTPEQIEQNIVQELLPQIPEKIPPAKSQESPPLTTEITEEIVTNQEISFGTEVTPEVRKVSEQVNYNSESSPTSGGAKIPVVGQVYINNLLLTLFPNRQGINLSSSQDQG